MFVGLVRFTLALGQTRSLKDKRKVVRSVVDRTRARFPVAIAEVDALDTFRSAVLGVTAVGNDGGHVREVLDAVVRDIESLYVAPIVAHDVRVVSFDDFEDPAWHDQGPNPFSREMLAGDPGDDPEPDGEDAVEDAPWALPQPRPRRPR